MAPRRPKVSARESDVTRRPARGQGGDAQFVARIHDAASRADVLEHLPDLPGVYIMRGRMGEVLYVGKARRLRQRVRQYFSGHDTRFFVPLLEKLVADIETMVVAHEKEALLLENNLIKEHRPRFNVKLRDDASYLVLRLDPSSVWPRLTLVRGMGNDGAEYFGPYHSARSARAALRVINRHFQLRTCTDYVLKHRSRPCLQYHIKRCPGPCVFDVDSAAYAEQVRDVTLFLSGRHRELTHSLQARMEQLANDLSFEAAARVRDQLGSLASVLQGQQVVSDADVNQDAVGMKREGGVVEFVVLHIRHGKLMAHDTVSQTGMELPDEEVLAGFLLSYYTQSLAPPDEVLLPFVISEDDRAPLATFLRDVRGKKVDVVTPARGARKRLVELAYKNAENAFTTRRRHDEAAEQALIQLQTRLGLQRIPRTIECFDISHFQGSDPVASMVVFRDGVAAPKRYRGFRIRAVGEGLQNDDFASMYEVLSRRLKRAVDESPGWELPDLLVIDGGKGQLGSAMAAMADVGVAHGVEGVEIVSLAKEREFDAPGRNDTTLRPERVFVPGVKDAVELRSGSAERLLLERVRDEAHRFAISFHRKRRGKRALASALDTIEGVGPKTRRILLEHFGSMRALKAAELSALQDVSGVGPVMARKVFEALHGSDS